MKLGDILKNIDCKLRNLNGEEEIMYITASADGCDGKTLLIIPNSKNADPKRIEECGACAIMCDGELPLPEHLPVISVKNARRALAFAFSDFYSPDYNKMKVIGITGTNGKTSTATFIEEILKSNGYKTGFIGTGRIEIDGERINDENYSLTTPDPSLLYKVLKQMELSGCAYAVMEVSSHALALSKVDPIPFEYGIMTNLSPEHMDFHSDIEDYYNAKKHLFSLCKTGIFNIDDAYCRRAYNEFSGKKISAGVLFKGDVYSSNINDLGLCGVEYLYHGKNFVFGARLSVAGIYNVYNSMQAIALATDMGILPCRVKESLSRLQLIEGRFEIIKDEITVIIDYAHTDFAMETVLRSIRQTKGSGEFTVLFGAGGERDPEKRPRMARAAEKYADRIIVTSDNSRGEDPMSIISDITRGFEKNRYKVLPDREAAIRYAILSANANDTVAIIGKGCERYNIDSSGYRFFDERDIIKRALSERKENEN